jgi:prepilin-type N-terminal cleavage/methylation domain-containing protein
MLCIRGGEMRSLRSSGQNIQLKMLLRFFSKGNDRGGFTLIELLVAMLISGLIVSGLLYLVVEVLGINQKDASRSDTQRDMQLAMDYITRDLREAFYVYGTETGVDTSGQPTAELVSCLSSENQAKGKTDDRGKSGQCSGLLNYLPKHLEEDNNIPVLAFWKPEALPENSTGYCKTNLSKIGAVERNAAGNPIDNPVDRVPCVAKRMYTLVVYSLSNENSGIWKGRARIKRYALPHFSEAAATGVKNGGWVAPVSSDDKRPLSWPFGKAINNTQEGLGDLQQLSSSSTVGPAGPATGSKTDNVVLTDFVDYVAPTQISPLLTATTSSGYCPAGFEVANFGKFTPVFYACVRRASINENPEVRVVIKGNAAGRGGIPFNTGEVPFQMESHVIGRAAYGKQRSGG